MNYHVNPKCLNKTIEEILGKDYYCLSHRGIWGFVHIYKKRGCFGVFSKMVGGYDSWKKGKDRFIRCNCPMVAKKLRTHLCVKIVEDWA